RARECPSASRRDQDHHANAGSGGVGEVPVELLLVGDGRRVLGVPAERDSVLLQAGGAHLPEEPGATVARELAAVVGGAYRQIRGGCAACAQRGDEAGECGESELHSRPRASRTAPRRLSAPNRTGSSVGRPVSSFTRAISARASSSSSAP